MSIALSEQCNLNCTYCNVDKLSKKKISGPLFLEEYWKKRAEVKDELIKFDFYGGEPLLQWDIVKEIIEATKDEKNLQYFMPTNGLLLNNERVDYLNLRNVLVSLSYDGLWQKDQRLHHDGSDSSPQFLAKTSLFKKIKKIECHTMIYKDNVNLLENHLYILNTLGLNPDLTIVRDVGVWDKEGAEAFNLGFSQLVNWYIENVDSQEMPNLIREYLGHILLNVSKNISVDYCGASETHFSFTEDKLLPCNRFKEADTIAKIPEFKKMEACQDCSVSKFCKKGCLYENIKNNGPLLEICQIYRHIYQELICMVKLLNTNDLFKSKFKEILNEC